MADPRKIIQLATSVPKMLEELSRYKQPSKLAAKIAEPSRTQVLPMPNRWFLQPDKYPKQQPLVERVLQANNMDRTDFFSGANVDPKTAKVLDFNVMDDLGVSVNGPHPSMSGVPSGMESFLEVPESTGPLTRSNLVRRGLFKPVGGDPMLNDLSFLATIERSGAGHQYGLGTEYMSPAELTNTMTGENPTLRPHSRGDLFGMGDVVGRIQTPQGWPTDVYESLLVAPKGSDVKGVKLHKKKGGAIDQTIAQAKSKSTPQPWFNAPVRKPNQIEQGFDQYVAAKDEARRKILGEVPERLARSLQGAGGALLGYAAQGPGAFGDAANMYQTFKPDSLGDLPAGVQALPTTDDIQDLLRENVNASPEFSAGMAGGNAIAIGQAAAAIPGLVRGAVRVAPKIAKSLVNEALAPRSGRRAQEGAVKLGGGNWPANSVEHSMKSLKTRPSWLDIEDIADAKARGLDTTVLERALANLKPALAVNNWVDKQLTGYVKNEMATPKDSIRLAADAFPAAKTKLLEAKQAQLDKAVAARDKLQVERNVAPEILTRSNARIRELETEKRLIEYRKGLHGGVFEEYANVNPFAELTPADMFDTNLASRRAAAGMPAEGFGKTPMGKAWENATDEGLLTTRAGDTWGAAAESFDKLPPDTPTYDLVGGVDDIADTLGFKHLIDEIGNAVRPESTLPAQFRIDAKDLSKWTVPQMSEHVDKINAWRKVQSEDAINASREGIPVHKEYPEGYQWLAVPDLETNPEALKYATEVGCQGGWCTEGASTATRYGSGNNRLYVLHDPEGKAVAQISTQPNLVDPVAAKYAKLEQGIREEIRADAMARNPHVDKRLWEAPVRPGTLSNAELAMRDTQLSEATLRRFPELAEQSKLKRIAEIKGLQNQMPSPEDLPFIQDFVRSGKWSDVGDLQNTGLKNIASSYGDEPLAKAMREKLGDYATQDEIDLFLYPWKKPEGGMKRGGPVNQDAMQMAVWNKAIRKQVGGDLTQAEIDAAMLPATVNPNFQRQATKIKSQGERDFPIMGPLELGSQVLSGTAAMIPATLYGVYKDIASRKPGDPYSGQAAGNQAVKDALEMLTYQPRTAPGQDWSREFGQIMETSKLPPYFGHLGTPHVVPGVGRLLMENATAPADPFFAGPLGRQRGAVKPPVDLSRRGFFGLPKEATSTENALVPANTSITSAPIASERTSISPLEYLIQKIANAPTLRRDFLEQVAKTTASQALKGTLPNVVQRTLKDIGVHEVAKADLAALEGYSRVRNHIDDAVEEGSFFPANWSSDEIIREVIKDPELFGIANASPSLLNKIAGLIETHGFENAAITTALPKMNTRLVEPELRPGTVFVTPDATKDVLAAMWDRELKQNALVPANTSITSAPIASELTSISPLEHLTQKIANAPMSRRDFLEQTAKTAASQALNGTLPNVVQNALKDVGLKETLKVENPLADIERSVKRYFLDDATDAWQADKDPFTLFPFVEKHMTAAQKLEINKAKNLVSEDSPNWMSSEDMSERQIDSVMKELANFSKIVDEHIDDVPFDSVVTADAYKIDLEDLQSLGYKLTPEIVERIKNTDWGPGIFNDFDLTKLQKAKGGLVKQGAMNMPVMNKQLRKQHG